MKSKIIIRYFALSSVIFFTFLVLNAQQTKSHFTSDPGVPSATSNRSAEDYAHVFFYYPLAKSGTAFSVYLNKKNIAKLGSGGRLECKLLMEGPMAITLIEGSAYREPLTQSKNTRTITIKKGKSYYFHVNGAGELDYVFNVEKGEKNFTEPREFTIPPIAFTENSGNTVPALTTTNN